MTIVGALPFTLQNGTTADATQVMADFNSIKTDVNAHAAANGANNDITSLSGLTTPLSVSQGGSGSATPSPFVFTGGYRNIARRNGGLEIWQRGAGGSANIAVGASSVAYTADGWYLLTNANQVSQVAQIDGSVGVSLGSQWGAAITRNNGQTGTGVMVFGYPLDTDELYPMLGQFVRLSFCVYKGAGFSPASGIISYSLNVGTGTPVKFSVGYTGATVPLSGTVAVTSTNTRVQASSTVFVPVTTRQAEIRFFWTPVGTAGVNDSVVFDDVQLEIVPAATGYVASNFERLNFTETLQLCKRHYQKTFPYAVAPASNTTDAYFAWYGLTATEPSLVFWNLPVDLRLQDTAGGTLYNPNVANAQIRNQTSGADWSGSSADQISNNIVGISGVPDVGFSLADFIAVNVAIDAGI